MNTDKLIPWDGGEITTKHQAIAMARAIKPAQALIDRAKQALADYDNGNGVYDPETGQRYGRTYCVQSKIKDHAAIARGIYEIVGLKILDSARMSLKGIKEAFERADEVQAGKQFVRDMHYAGALEDEEVSRICWHRRKDA